MLAFVSFQLLGQCSKSGHSRRCSSISDLKSYHKKISWSEEGFKNIRWKTLLSKKKNTFVVQLCTTGLCPLQTWSLLYSIAVTHYWQGCGALRPLNAKQRQCLDGTMKSVFSPKCQYLFCLKNSFVWNFVPCYWFPCFVTSSGRAVLGWQLRLLVQSSAMNGVESWMLALVYDGIGPRVQFSAM